MDQAAAAGIGLDAKAIVGAVDGQVGDKDRAYAAIRLAADRHAVSGIKMVMRNRDVSCRAGASGFDGYVVIAGAYVGVSNRDIRQTPDRYRPYCGRWPVHRCAHPMR